jgi:hypothetical protein
MDGFLNKEIGPRFIEISIPNLGVNVDELNLYHLQQNEPVVAEVCAHKSRLILQ